MQEVESFYYDDGTLQTDKVLFFTYMYLQPQVVALTRAYPQAVAGTISYILFLPATDSLTFAYYVNTVSIEYFI